MQSFFTHILVPVNFNRNTPMVMEKALAIANQFGCDITVLHVQTSMRAASVTACDELDTSTDTNASIAQTKMQELMNNYRSRLNDGLMMTPVVTGGKWYTCIKEMIITSHIDLVIVPRHPIKFFAAILYKVNINRLAQQTRCPVLTVTEGFEIAQLNNIVVPVYDFLPIRKLRAATCMAGKLHGVIHLLGYNGASLADDKRNTKSLVRSYQLLHDHAQVKVFCTSRSGSAMAADTLAYARTVNADLIVINSGDESMYKGWFSKLIGKYLYKESNIPVLTIAPQKN